MPHFYISGALTGCPSREVLIKFYEEISNLCLELGFTAYLPHQHTDPTSHHSMSPREVFDKDRNEVSKADFLIAYVGVPSLGVGIEIEMARELKIPVILLYEEGRRISRIAKGNPAVIIDITFSDFRLAIDKLRAFLIKV